VRDGSNSRALVSLDSTAVLKILLPSLEHHSLFPNAIPSLATRREFYTMTLRPSYSKLGLFLLF